jgi:hypothetical protein
MAVAIATDIVFSLWISIRVAVASGLKIASSLSTIAAAHADMGAGVGRAGAGSVTAATVAAGRLVGCALAARSRSIAARIASGIGSTAKPAASAFSRELVLKSAKRTLSFP